MDAVSFRRVASVSWFMQALIVVSGAAVRLTEAGLGCEDWPTCNDDQVLPEWQLHGLIEFGNRVISLFVTVSAVAVVVAAYRRAPRRRDLTGYAWAVLAGTVAQIVLGGITVLLDLHPMVVAVHFLVSMVLLWASAVLWFRAGPQGTASALAPARFEDHSPTQPDPTEADAGEFRRQDAVLVAGQLALATAVLATGTVVTGTGPHSGDTRADRLSFELESVTRVHSTFVWLLLATLTVLAIRLARRGGASVATRATVDTDSGEIDLWSSFTVLRVLMGAVLVQGAIGYTQFALGVPAALVELHIIGAVIVWNLSVLLCLYNRVHDVGGHTAQTRLDRKHNSGPLVTRP